MNTKSKLSRHKLTAAQRRQLCLIVEHGQVVETFNGRRTWTRSVAGLTSSVLVQLVRLGLVYVEGERNPNYQTVTRFMATDAGRAEVCQ